MRELIVLSAALMFSGCAGANSVVRATMPVEILRAEGQAPRMGNVVLEAGGYQEADRFSLSVYFESDGIELGKPRQVSWSVKLGDYCRNRPSWAQAVLIGPSGQVWRGWRRAVPAGPDRSHGTLTGSSGATGPGAVATPGLLEAMIGGGRFTVAFDDDEGQRWNEVAVDTLSPAQRTRLFAANRAAVDATDPESFPVRSQGVIQVVVQEPFSPPSPRPCP